MLSGMTNPVVGGAVTGLTSPTFTHTTDTPPNAHSEQVAVTVLGGTQTGSVANSVSSPFTITVERPANLRMVGVPNPITNVLGSVAMNVYTVRVRKGAVPLTGQAPKTCRFEAKLHIPAGTDSDGTADIRSGLSAFIGALNDLSTDIGVLQETGVL